MPDVDLAQPAPDTNPCCLHCEDDAKVCGPSHLERCGAWKRGGAPPPPPPPTYAWVPSGFAPCAETCGPRAVAARLAETACAGTTVPGGVKFVASAESLCTADKPAATQACATLAAASACDDGKDETMGDECASEEAGSCAGTVRRAPAFGAALAARRT